ncbi:ribonuclease H-like domain-containing protein [Tanacetum coccineum]
MAGAHAYHEGKEILKEDRKESEFQCKENVGFDKTKFDQQREVLSKANLEIIAYQLGLESLEARIVLHQKNEAVYEEDIAFLKYDVNVRNEIEEENNQVNDRFKKVKGYHAVPPPYTGNYMPSRPDLSFAGLDDSVYKTNVSETITSVPRNESTASKSSKDSLEQPKDVRPSAPIIEEWESDSDDDYENTRKSVIEQNTYRQADNLRKSQKAFSVDQETGQMLKCENDQKRHIVVVEKGLKFVSPIMSRQQQCGGYGPTNNLEDSICSMKLRENIDDVSKAIFTTHNPDTLHYK